MKKINLIERLLSYSHEKQSPQRFARYAAMLIMLLTLGVGQMKAEWNDSWKTEEVAVHLSKYMAGFNTAVDQEVTFTINGSSITKKSADSDKGDDRDISDYNITTSLAITGYKNYMYHKHKVTDASYNGANIKDNYMSWKILDPNSDEVGNGTYNGGWINEDNWSVYDNNSCADNTEQHQRWGGSGSTYNLLNGVSASTSANQTYTIEFWFHAGCKLCGSSCSEFESSPQIWYPGNSTNFKYQFTIPQTTLTVNHSGDNGSAVVSSGISSSIEYNHAYSLSASEITGYHFVNWTTSDGSITITNPTSRTGATVTFTSFVSATITANYAPDTYDITYKDQGNVTYSGSNEGSLPSSYTYGTGIASLTDGVKSGFRFGGWYTDSECTEEPVTSISTTDTGDKTFYAQWLEVPVINDVELSSTVVTGGTTITATPDITDHGQTVTVCWKVLDAEGEPLASQPTFTPGVSGAVSFAAPTTPDAYKLQATLREGSDCEGDILDTEIKTFVVESQYTVSITNGTGSSTVGTITTATVNPAAAPDGKKFKQWEITGTYTTSGALTDRTFTFNATSDISITATYEDRDYVKIYFKAPGGDWDPPYAYVWKSSDDSKKNAAYPGEPMSTETVNCVEYYYYKYYIDNNGESSDLTAQAEWDKVIFNKGEGSNTEYPTPSWNKTHTLNVANGHFYFYHCAANSTGSAYGSDWYLRGDFNGTADWSSWDKPITINCATNEGYVDMEDLSSSNDQFFRIYQISTEKEFRITSLSSNAEVSMSTEYTLHNQSSGADYFTPVATTDYRFTLNVATPSAPVLTVAPNDMTEYSATLSIDGHGSLDKATGIIQLKQYIPTTITATPEPGYRFKQWNVSGVSCSSTTSATATFTASAAGGTIEAEFTNDEVIYFDAGNIENEWSNEVYVTFFSANFHWNDGDGKDGSLIIENWVNNALHSVRMTQIPNTRIYYLDYSNLTGHESVGQYVLFTSKDFDIVGGPDYYKLYDMAAVTRGDYNKSSGNNMLVAENYREKDKNKVGYYVGYWMNYNDEKAGVYLKVYGGTGAIESADGDFTLTATGSREYSASITLSANTTYKMELQGYNGTYYKNSGTMVSTNCTSWSYVDREPTVGKITTTAGGTYKFILSCADKLYLTADYPLAKGDYRLVFNGKVSTTGITEQYSSEVIRHATAEGTKKDTLSFFVVKDDSWTLKMQKCTDIDPITWVDIAGTSKTASNFGNPATGIYNFIVQQDSATGTPITPAYATMTPEAYTGNYYIRTDAADGGWEAYKKSLDNRMIFSNYPKQHSGYDHYHCKYKGSGTNVKFCIANDYSTRLSDTLYTDTYVTTGEGLLPSAANIRFMWNSETNVVSRAYLNGSSTTDFLVLAAKNDSIKNADGSSISKSGDYNQVKFEDKNNWVYQKEVQALEGTHYRLTSNYRFGSPESDHIQYFIGSDGDWTSANTKILIGGTTANSWQTLRLVYDFKTNHLTAAWLPPTTDIETAKHIEADMLLIRTGQNAAQQLTFTGSGSVEDVKTMVGAIELRYDSIVGRVGNFNGDVIGASGNRANRELMYYISFPFDVAVSDIYGFGQLNKEWYLQYYDGAERASKGWFKGDGTTTFWKFMTLSDTLKANVGYSLLLDNEYFNTTGTGKVWENMSSGAKIYLYFPSAKELDGKKVIKSGSAVLTVPEHECTIDRTFVSENSGRTVSHKFTDSHWNMMGVPLFQNQTSVETTKFIAEIDEVSEQDLKAFPANQGYFYEWDSLANTLSVRITTGYTFKSMHGYMVQFTGTVGFTGSSIQPKSIAARRTNLNREDYTLELQLLQNNNRVTRTYVELREEACDTFALNEDVYMMYSSAPANLYTFAGNYDVSANVLPVDNHVIPVGVAVRKAGTFTFTMPSDFNGGVTLVDNVLNTRTNLAISDYEVTLPKGVCEGRFYLEIDIRKMPTSIDVIEEGGSLKDGKAHKFIQNGVMYILRDGKLYDAQGARVK